MDETTIFTRFTSSTRLYPPNLLFILLLYKKKSNYKVISHPWPVYLTTRLLRRQPLVTHQPSFRTLIPTHKKDITAPWAQGELCL